MSDKQEPSENGIRYVNLYEAESKIYTRKVSGFFQNVRRYTGLPLLAGFLLLPWIMLGDRPAVLFDLPARKFHIFELTFWPQDFMLLAWLLIIAAFALFTVTVLFGRVWCGFTCPQTVWTLMYISIESFCEGDRNKRIKLDKAAWSPEKIFRKGSKHFLWLLVAFITGITFIGYFYPIRELLIGFIPYRNDAGMLQLDAPLQAVFWTLFFTGMTYLNAGWLREQVCKYMCLYARFQSVMYDSDTLAVHYDSERGENRGPRKPKDDYKAAGLGDCIDCSWCVQVCPVDIDIRDGLQYECINCGLCVDACNTVMDKMDYERGLIGFTSEDRLKTGKAHLLRLRPIGYSIGVILMMSAFIYTVATRTPLTVDVVRDRGVKMYRIAGTDVQNVYTVKINNMDQQAHRYEITATGDYPFTVKKTRPFTVEEGETFTIPIRVSVDKKLLDREKSMITFHVQAKDNPELKATEVSNFIGPSR